MPKCRAGVCRESKRTTRSCPPLRRPFFVIRSPPCKRLSDVSAGKPDNLDPNSDYRTNLQRSLRRIRFSESNRAFCDERHIQQEKIWASVLKEPQPGSRQTSGAK